MLITDDARLHKEAGETFFKWRYNNRQSSEKLDAQTLVHAMLAETDHDQAVVALRVKQENGWRVTDLLCARVPLGEVLSVISFSRTETHGVLALAIDGVSTTLQLLNESTFMCASGWALDQGLIRTVTISKGTRTFELTPVDFFVFSPTRVVLSQLSEHGGGYLGVLEHIEHATQKCYELRCRLPRAQLWNQSIDRLSRPQDVRLHVSAAWVPKHLCYEVTAIEPCMPEGISQCELVGLKTQGEIRFWLLECPLPACLGLVFTGKRYPRTSAEITMFEPSPDIPLLIEVSASYVDGRLSLQIMRFVSVAPAPLWADVTLANALREEVPGDESKPVMRIELSGYPGGRLVFEQPLKVPQSYYLSFDSEQAQRVPLVFSLRYCRLDFAVDLFGDVVQGAFRVRDSDPESIYLQQAGDDGVNNDLCYRVKRTELLRFGIAGIRKDVRFECVIEVQAQSRKDDKKFPYWHMREVLTDLTAHVSRQQYSGVSLKALWAWSAFDASSYESSLPAFFRRGAVVVAQPEAEISLALFLSSGLLRKAGYSVIDESGRVSLDYRVSPQSCANVVRLVCTQLFALPSGSPRAGTRARYLGEKKPDEHQLECIEPDSGSLAPGTILNYRQRAGSQRLKDIPNLEKAIFVVRTNRFNGTHQVSRILNVELSVDV